VDEVQSQLDQVLRALDDLDRSIQRLITRRANDILKIVMLFGVLLGAVLWNYQERINAEHETCVRGNETRELLADLNYQDAERDGELRIQDGQRLIAAANQDVALTPERAQRQAAFLEQIRADNTIFMAEIDADNAPLREDRDCGNGGG
jgi:hypothetical protein